MRTPALPLTPELTRRLGGSPLLLLLDIDGTLSPIAPRPEYAVVPLEMQHALNGLSALPGVHLAIVTGRCAIDAARLVCAVEAWTIGNHGFELAEPRQAPVPRADVALVTEVIALAVARCREIAALDPGIMVEDKRLTLSVHYRLAHPRVVPELVQRVSAVAEDLGLRLTLGKEVLEIRPPLDVDKGTAAISLATRLGALEPGASVLCAGDDRTDEDMFRALREAKREAVTVRVGEDSLPTEAEFGVPHPEAMRALLEALLEQRASKASA